MKKSVRVVGAVLFALTSVACQSDTSAFTAPSLAAALDAVAVTSPLQGSTWRLVEINGQKALGAATVTATFGASNSLSGSGGCNRYVGAATANEGKLTVGPLASTRMYCAQDGVSDQEDKYFSLLAKATGYTVVGAELRLHTGAGNALLVFVRE